MTHHAAAATTPSVLGTALVTALVASLGTLSVAPPAGAASSAPSAPECTTRGPEVRCLFVQPSAVARVFTVPAGVVNLEVAARGGSGGPGDADQSSDCTDGALSLPRAGTVRGAPGGLGGTASAVLNVERGQVLDLYVGGLGASANGITGGAGGVNGGAAGGTVQLDPSTDVCDPFNQFGGGGGGGGGGSFVMAHGTLPQVAVPLLAAGGGGGGGGTYGGAPGGSGGSGGGAAGDAGDGGANRGWGGASRGGSGGPGADSGDRGSGGLGAASLSAPGAGGGGGGGFFGGGGGGSGASPQVPNLAVRSGGGGGGSGFVAGAGPGVRLRNGAVGPGSVSGPGEIAISYRLPATRAASREDAATTPADRRVSAVQRAARRAARQAVRRARSGSPSRGR